MKVKTCNECPYTPEDLGHNYDPAADLYCCGRCPKQGMIHAESHVHYFREWIRHPKRTLWFKRQEVGNGQNPLPSM